MNRTDIDYGHDLNGGQKENRNAAKLGAVVAGRGYSVMWFSDDCINADLIALREDGDGRCCPLTKIFTLTIGVPLMVTALYASLLAILLFILSIRVIGLRGNPAFAFIAQGKGDDELLQRAIRAQGNLTEYAPTMLILLFLLETSGVADAKLHALAGAFLLGRVRHGICMGFMRSNMPLRVGGTALTLLPLAAAAVALLMQALEG